MRFHVIALPHTNTSAEFPSCAFTQKVVRFTKMMKDKGHEVFLYGGSANEAECDEFIPCVTKQSQVTMRGGRHYTSADWNHPLWSSYNYKVIEQIKKRVKKEDFICLIGGFAQKSIADAFPHHLSVEFGIGYSGTFAKFRVFESYAWMHMIYGADTGGNAGAKDGHWYDAVIPNQIDDELIKESDFGLALRGPCDFGVRGPVGTMPNEKWDSKTHKERQRLDDIEYERQGKIHDWTCEQCRGDKKYALYVGRLIDRKGFHIAQEVCQAKGIDLVLAGPGEQKGYGHFVGEVDAYERNALMANAVALFAPTIYVEPFGTVTIEAMAQGTPIISTDWGVFTETVQHGVHGFRCRTFKEFSEALDKVETLDRDVIKKYARERFSMATVANQYEEYFQRLSGLWGKGWYSL